MNKVLVVDDDLGFRDIMSIVAKRKGWEIAAVADWCEVIDRILVKDFALIICDYKLRNKTALGLMDFLKETNCKTPIIIVTASDDIYIEKLIANGIEVYDKLKLHLEDIYRLFERFK